MKMSRVKKISIVMVIIFIISIPVLYAISDTRLEILREIYIDSGIFLPKGTTYLGDINKEPSFFGDGIALRLVEINEDNEEVVLKELEKNMKKIDRSSDEFSHLESAYNARNSKNYEIEHFDFYSNDNIYYFNSLIETMGNFRGVVYNPTTNYFLLVVLDS